MALLLGVNIDHVATLRQARYARLPDSPNAEPCPLEAGLAAMSGGADSLTIHVRGDRRHMQERDAFRIRERIDLPLNFEMGVTEEMLEIALRLRPAFACLVPETREEVTTEGGLDVVGSFARTREAVAKLMDAGVRVSLFIDPDGPQVEAAAATGAEMIELHTGCFANAFEAARAHETDRLAAAARLGNGLGLQVNAGHGINLKNLPDLFRVRHLVELNIGHSIVARAVFIGMQAAVAEMRAAMAGYPETMAD